MRLILTACLLLLTTSAFAESYNGTFRIEWDECSVIDSVLASPLGKKVNIVKSAPVNMTCIKKASTIMCDYEHETTGKLKNQPSNLSVEAEAQGYIFASNEQNTMRLHINLTAERAILKNNIFFTESINYFGVKLCSGKIKKTN